MWVLIGAGAIFTALALAAAGCCGLLYRRHRRHQKDNPHHSMLDYVPAAVPYFGRRNRRHAANAVDPAAGKSGGAGNAGGGQQAGQGGAGSGVDPALAAAAGAAAGSALSEKHNDGAGQTTGADDGRGTMGRKAEEGRGKVAFADGGAAADPAQGAGQQVIATSPSGQQVVTTAAAAPAEAAEKSIAAPAEGAEKVVSSPATAEQVVTTTTTPGPVSAEHVEPITIHHDGSSDGIPTGRQVLDMGSMRGRKKNRNNKGGQQEDLLNLRF